MIDVTVDGTKNKKKIAVLKEAAEFFSNILMSKNINLTVDIEVQGYKYDLSGECINEDGTRRSRWFTILLKNEPLNDMVRTLAHEMVHVKQHVRNELGDRAIVMHKNGKMTTHTEWKGSAWVPGRNENGYFDAPWEIEAYGREVGLTHRFLQYKDKVSL